MEREQKKILEDAQPDCYATLIFSKDVNVIADLDKDGDLDGVVLANDWRCGTGQYKSLYVFENEQGILKNVSSVYLGDRTPVRKISFENDYIVVDMIGSAPDDALCCATLEQVRRYRYEDYDYYTYKDRDLAKNSLILQWIDYPGLYISKEGEVNKNSFWNTHFNNRYSFSLSYPPEYMSLARVEDSRITAEVQIGPFDYEEQTFPVRKFIFESTIGKDPLEVWYMEGRDSSGEVGATREDLGDTVTASGWGVDPSTHSRTYYAFRSNSLEGKSYYILDKGQDTVKIIIPEGPTSPDGFTVTQSFTHDKFLAKYLDDDVYREAFGKSRYED